MSVPIYPQNVSVRPRPRSNPRRRKASVAKRTITGSYSGGASVDIGSVGP